MSKTCLAFALFVAMISAPLFASHAFAAEQKSPSILISKDGWIRSWLVGGPFGMAGVSSIAPFYEEHFTPISGMQWDQWWLDTVLHVTWKQYISPDDKVSMDTPETFADRPGFEWPIGRPGCAYAHLYVTLPGQMDVLLDFESSQRAAIFLNGKPLRSDKSTLNDPTGGFERRKDDPPFRTAMTMEAGTNRLMVKLFFPQAKFRAKDQRDNNETWFRCRFLSIDGTPISGMVVAEGYAQANAAGASSYSIDPPDLLAAPNAKPGHRLGDLITTTFKTAAPYDTFLTTEDVNVTASLTMLPADQRQARFGANETLFDATPNSVTVNWLVFDFDGGIVARDSADTTVAFGKQNLFDIKLGRLPRGHYTIQTEIRQGAKLVAQPKPMMLVVVDPPTLPLPGVQSKFAHSFYYLLNGAATDDDRNFPSLAMAKVRLHIGSASEWWITIEAKEWAALPAEKRVWTRAPEQARIDHAKRMGIELVGQIGGFYAGRRAGRFKDNPAAADNLIINDCWDIGPMGSPEVDKIVDTYVYETVKKYGKNFRYWRMNNEMNNRGFTPAELAHLHTVCSKAMKRAADETGVDAKLWGGSISGFDTVFVDKMIQLGYDRAIDVHDYHYYIWPQPDSTYRDMGGLTQLIDVFKKYHVKKPIANGEFGCYRSIFRDGARVQAGMFARAIASACATDELICIAPHFWTTYDWTSHIDEGMLPSYLAYRTSADLLEGAKFVGMMKLGDGIAAYRFKRPSGKTVIVLWDNNERAVTVPGVDASWTAYDVIGRKTEMNVTEPIKLGVIPIYLTNGPLDEGTELTPMK